MPVVKVNQKELTKYLRDKQDGYDYRFFRVWVQSLHFDISECSTLIDYSVRKHDCQDLLPFFCEKDPDIRVVIDQWYREPLGIAALAISTVTALLSLCCISCWLCKSREKAKEKLQRRNSIRASIRSNRSAYPSNNSLNEIAYKRQLEKVIMSRHPNGSVPPFTPSDVTASYVVGRNHSNRGSMESFQRDSTTHEPFENESRVSLNYRAIEDRFAQDAALENANVSMMVRPTFDLTFENDAFRETSIGSEHLMLSIPSPESGLQSWLRILLCGHRLPLNALSLTDLRRRLLLDNSHEKHLHLQCLSSILTKLLGQMQTTKGYPEGT